MLATIVSAAYGVVNDQITVTFSPEYFSVFKRGQFWDALEQFGMADAPRRLQAMLVGALATWWFGLSLGLLLGVVGASGQRPIFRTREFLRAVVGSMAFTLLLSALSGAMAFAVEPAVKPDADKWPCLSGISYVKSAFAVGWWYGVAYLDALLGTMMACRWKWRRHGPRGIVDTRRSVTAGLMPRPTVARPRYLPSTFR